MAAVQGMHALVEFSIIYGETITKEWYNNSNYLAFLLVKDESELVMLANRAQDIGICVALFREPDRDNEVTAIALEPCLGSKKLCCRLPLAFSG